jgi:hypothetical protein
MTPAEFRQNVVLACIFTLLFAALALNYMLGQ